MAARSCAPTRSSPATRRCGPRTRTRKRVVLDAIRDASRAAPAADPDALALQLLLIVEGATTAAYAGGGAGETSAAARELALAALERASLG
jgi:hypothetical protein